MRQGIVRTSGLKMGGGFVTVQRPQHVHRSPFAMVDLSLGYQREDTWPRQDGPPSL